MARLGGDEIVVDFQYVVEEFSYSGDRGAHSRVQIDSAPPTDGVVHVRMQHAFVRREFECMFSKMKRFIMQ